MNQVFIVRHTTVKLLLWQFGEDISIKKLYEPFLRMGFNCLKATEPQVFSI